MIPAALRERLAADPFMRRCVHGGRPTSVRCAGRVEWEHALIYSGRQVNEAWAIVPVCTYHHRGAGLDKNLNRHVALQRATAADLEKYPRESWPRMKEYLAKKYGGNYPHPT